MEFGLSVVLDSSQGVTCVRDFKEFSLEGVGSCFKNKVLCSIIMATCWLLLLAPNDVIFNKAQVMAQSVLDKI